MTKAFLIDKLGKLAIGLVRRIRDIIITTVRAPNLSGDAKNLQTTIFIDNVSESAAPCDILVQVDNFEAGGLENVVIDLNTTLSQAGYRVVLLVLGSQGAAVNRARDLGQIVICCKYSSDMYAALINKLEPKLVLGHYSFQGITQCRQKAIPFVQVIHNIYMWFSDQQRREFADAAAMTTAFVAVSEYVKSYSVSRLGVENEKCIVITNGINLEPFKNINKSLARTRLRSNYGIADNDFVFLDVGAINHQKNHLGMVKAFEIASRICKKSRLAILGPCYETGLLQEILVYVKKHRLQDRVIYCESAPSVCDHMAMADAFVSATFFEGGPLTLLEAIAANIPIAMPSVGYASRFAGRKGIKLVEPICDMAAFSSSIWEMKSNGDFEERLAEALVDIWKNPLKPDFSEEQMLFLSKERAYENYVHLVSNIVGSGFVGDKEYKI